MSKKILEINNKTFVKKILSRHVAAVQAKVGNRPFSGVLYDMIESPVECAVPFIWGMLSSQGAGVAALAEGAEYSLYDELVDAGFGPTEFFNLVIDILENSGFFTAAQKTTLRKIPETMEKMNLAMMTKMQTGLEALEQKASESKNSPETATPSGSSPANSGAKPTAKTSAGSKRRSIGNGQK